MPQQNLGKLHPPAFLYLSSHSPPQKILADLSNLSGPSLASLATLADNPLFQSIVSNPDLVLRHLCQERPASQHNLRPRPHPFVLPNSDPKNVLPQLLYKDTY